MEIYIEYFIIGLMLFIIYEFIARNFRNNKRTEKHNVGVPITENKLEDFSDVAPEGEFSNSIKKHKPGCECVKCIINATDVEVDNYIRNRAIGHRQSCPTPSGPDGCIINKSDKTYRQEQFPLLENKFICPGKEPMGEPLPEPESNDEFLTKFINFRDWSNNSSQQLNADSVDKVLMLYMNESNSPARWDKGMKIKDVFDYATTGIPQYQRNCARVPDMTHMEENTFGANGASVLFAPSQM